MRTLVFALPFIVGAHSQVAPPRPPASPPDSCANAVQEIERRLMKLDCCEIVPK